MHGLDDVAPLAQFAHGGLQPLRKRPHPQLPFPGKPIALKCLKPADAKRSVEVGADLAGLGTEVERASSRFLDHCPVNAGEALGPYLGLKLLPQLQIRFRPELQRRALLGPQPHAVGDVVLGNDQVLAEVVLAADDDMAVRVAGVEMVDRYPVEFGAEIGLHLAHDVSGEAAQIGQAVAVLGRDDEPEGVAVLRAALDEGTAVAVIGVATIELTAPAIAGGAVALEIAQVGAGSA